MAAEYTKKDLEAIRKLCEAEAPSVKKQTLTSSEEEVQEGEESLSEEEMEKLLTEAMMQQMGLNGGEESSFEEDLNQSFVLRTLTGRGVMKIHWFSTPEKICW